MDKYIHLQNTLKEDRERRKKQFWISILQMVVVLTGVSLFFTFLIQVVWASPIDERGNRPSQQPVPQKEVALEIKDIQALPIKEEAKKEVMKEKASAIPYKEHLPLPKEHQSFLYKKTKELGLDFDKALAVMEHESKFDPNAIGETNDYGYFQVNAINHEWLSEMTGTPNKPLDPYVNIEWGTYMLSWLRDYWVERGLGGEALDNAVWSSYNKGIQGFRETGSATEYVAKVKESLKLVRQ